MMTIGHGKLTPGQSRIYCYPGLCFNSDQVIYLSLFDLGAEYAGYTADITVSWPANGKFSDNQKFVYNTCLKANRAVLTSMRPGAYVFLKDECN